ncbi:hypothetical protein OH76DRAFT_751317 [Lentinus brumalis]|uniref:Uncharacterized protein n=1 Tax=Lentinus brumalis TaxID=2498619 RepID=A0A371DST0_9APHY|nr:hypothetical protein OH76DRAFT_751317 [Polyporus brumalis]
MLLHNAILSESSGARAFITSTTTTAQGRTPAAGVRVGKHRVERPEMSGPGRRGGPGAKRGHHSVQLTPERWLPHGVHEMILTASQKRVIVYLQRGSFQSTSWPTHAGPPTCQAIRLPARGQWAYSCSKQIVADDTLDDIGSNSSLASGLGLLLKGSNPQGESKDRDRVQRQELR